MKDRKQSSSEVSALVEKFGIAQLDVHQRIALIEEIWASIDADTVDTELLSDAQRAEFEGRLNDEGLDEEDIQDLWEIEEALAYSRSRN